jgi:hypothetical protein
MCIMSPISYFKINISPMDNKPVLYLHKISVEEKPTEHHISRILQLYSMLASYTTRNNPL